MKIGIARKGGIYDFLPALLNSLPDIQARLYEPFESYDVVVGFKQDKAREIKFDPENEILEDLHYPVTIPYQKPDVLRLDRAACVAPPKIIRRYESIFSNIGRLVVDETYSDVRGLIHKSIPIEQSKDASGIQVILDSGYSAKVQLLTAMMRRQPFLLMNFDGAAEILRTLRCVTPWMLPFESISDAVGNLEFLKISTNLESALDDARQKCLSERLHSRNVHLWGKVLYG